MDIMEMLETIFNDGGQCSKRELEDAHTPAVVKEAVHRGLIRLTDDRISMCLTPRGDRVRQGLPGEAIKETEIIVDLRELVLDYLKRRPDQPVLEHFTFERGGKVLIRIKG